MIIRGVITDFLGQVKGNGWAYSDLPGWDRFGVSENLGKAAALPLITTLIIHNKQCFWDKFVYCELLISYQLSPIPNFEIGGKF